jgi:hypothetical protein
MYLPTASVYGDDIPCEMHVGDEKYLQNFDGKL